MSGVADLFGDTPSDPRARQRAKDRRYRRNSPEKEKAKRRRFYVKNRERMAAKSRAVRASLSSEERQRRDRETNLKHGFGISIADYDRLLLQQGGLCAICCKPETATRNGRVKRLAVDHDHVTEAIRGLLCQNCNTMLGQGRDSVALFTLAIAYLREHARG